MTKTAGGPPPSGNPWAAFAGSAARGSASGRGAPEGGPPAGRAAQERRQPDDPAGTPYHVRLYASVDAPSLVVPVARLITDHGGELVDLSIGKPSLEDVFIHLTGRALR